MPKSRRARAVAIAATEDAARLTRLRLFAVAVFASAALLALPVFFY